MFAVKNALITLASVLATVNSKKVFIENDGGDVGVTLIPLMAGWEVLGVSGSLGSASYVDAVGGQAKVLEDYGLTECIPCYAGAATPLLRTNETFHLWEDLYGSLVWQGAWAPDYVDAYSWDDFTYNDTMPGALALIEAVKANKDSDPVEIFSAGTLTTVAQALSIYPDLVKDAAGLYIMGGYVDGQYAKATGSAIVDDLNSDINIIQDPEAAQMVLTAGWDHIIIGGNVTNAEVPSQEIYDEMINRAGGLENIRTSPYLTAVNQTVQTGNYTLNAKNDQNVLPFWDPVVTAFMVYPDIIEHTTDVALAVDTAYNSPFYGTVKIWSHDRAPKAVKTGNVTFVDSIDKYGFYDILMDAYFQNYTNYCDDGSVAPLDF